MSPTTAQFKCFKTLKDLLGVASEQRDRLGEQEKVLDQLVGGLDADKEAIREAMSFVVKKQRSRRKGTVRSLAEGGQMDELETEDATTQYQSISEADNAAAHKAMSKVFDVLEQLKKAKDPKSGAPLFGDPDAADPQEAERARQRLSEVLFEPLVREGVIPEWAVPRAYSKTQRYLDAAYKRYKATLEHERKEKIKSDAQLEANYSGAGTASEKVVAGLKKGAGKLEEFVLDRFSGTDEEKSRKLDRFCASASLAISTVGVVRGAVLINSVATDPNFYQGIAGQETERNTFANIGEKLSSVLPTEQVMPVLTWLDEQRSNGTFTFVIRGVEAPVELTKDLIETVLAASDIHDTDKVLDAVNRGIHEGWLEARAAKLIGEIDDALEEALAKADPVAAAAAKGNFEASVNTASFVRLAAANPPRGDELIEALADALEEAIASCLPDDESFQAVARNVKKDFLSKADADGLNHCLIKPKRSETGFADLLKSAQAALAAGLGVPGNDPNAPPPDAAYAGGAAAFQQRLKTRAVQDAIIKNVSQRVLTPHEEHEEMSREELLEYECALTLGEEGGELMALQQLIEKLIAELEKGRLVIELIGALGGTILNAATSGVDIARASVDVGEKTVSTTADVLGNEVLPALRAAKIILRMGLEITLLQEKVALWKKFEVQVKRAQKAGSPLSPAIQGFYNNKTEQILFKGIEQAMLAIQLAGNICQMTHEPHAMAAGKAISAIGAMGEAANTVAEVEHNEAQLRRAWATTKAALNNPANRKLGLKALLINPTLATHAIAYAAREERDPTARNFLKACGLNESTLDLGASEEKIRDYLTTLLYDDRKLLDYEQLKTDWQPSPLELTRANWYATCGRAINVATPKLRKQVPSAIPTALEKLELAGGYLEPLLKADRAEIDALLATRPEDHVARLTVLQSTLASLNKALDGYTPRAEDGTAHEEMQMLVLQYLHMSEERAMQIGLLLEVAQSHQGAATTGGGAGKA